MSQVKESGVLSNVFTGNSSDFLKALKQNIEQAQAIDLIVSFIMESGVRLLLHELENAAKRNVPIRILCGTYLQITQPSALTLLLDALSDSAEIRIYSPKGRSFHPKTYIFTLPEHQEIFVGSSNISASAFKTGIEWNYRISSILDPKGIQDFRSEFDRLFREESYLLTPETLKHYSDAWIRPKVYIDLEHNKTKQTDFSEISAFNDFSDIDSSEKGQEKVGLKSSTMTGHKHSGNDSCIEDIGDEIRQEKKSSSVYVEIVPRGPQIEALSALKHSRQNGARKALIQAATGIGKTYLAAFDSLSYQRVLFIAHRREILEQAEKAYKAVWGNVKTGFFDGTSKDSDSVVLFASIQTLGKNQTLEQYFQPDDFDYIVVDECHHMRAKTYERVLAYFKPKFLLGLTATPERTDGRSIYELCDFNVPYSIDLFKAINQGVLVPFHYYGIFDDTDYSKIRYQNGKYDTRDLESAYLNNKNRFSLIYRHFRKYSSTCSRVLAFCSTRKHAIAMARDFNQRGIRSTAVVSDPEPGMLCRKEAIQQLENGSLQVIFSVDMFSEGVDIPSIDLIMFLRPTESSIVFLQQLGRGLRKHPDKDSLTVLDFIGNYKNAFRIPNLLGDGSSANSTPPYNQNIPIDCILDFDLEIISLFERMNYTKANLSLQQEINDEFDRIQDMLGTVPTRIELYSFMDYSIIEQSRAKSAQTNLLKYYWRYRKKRDVLPGPMKDLVNTPVDFFVENLESMKMTRSYKLALLKAFLDQETKTVRSSVTLEQLICSWKEYFSRTGYWKDLNPHPSGEAFTYQQFCKMTDYDHAKLIKKNPIPSLLTSAKGMITKTSDWSLHLDSSLVPYLNNSSLYHELDDFISFRAVEYFHLKDL